MESDETSGINSSSKDVKKFASDAKWLRVTRSNDSIPALFVLGVSKLDPLDISALSRYFGSVFSMYKMIGGVGRRESACNSAAGKEAGKERPGR